MSIAKGHTVLRRMNTTIPTQANVYFQRTRSDLGVDNTRTYFERRLKAIDVPLYEIAKRECMNLMHSSKVSINPNTNVKSVIIPSKIRKKMK